MRSVALAIVLLLLPALAAAEGPRVELVVGEKAPPLERRAAEELAGTLQRLYAAEATVVPAAAEDAQHVIFVGSPRTNPQMQSFIGGWPKLSEQGHALKSVEFRGRPALLVGGGNPAATYWAAAEFGHRLGVRSLLYGDLDPIEPPAFSLAEHNVVLEPQLKTRAWRTLDRFPSGFESWGLADQQRLVRQLAKLKYNRLVIAVHPWQPFVDFEHDGIKKQTGVLWYGWQFPVSGDTAGRAAFGGAKLFENPDFAGQKTYEERIAAGQKLVRGIIAEARDLGMTVRLSVDPQEFPAEFAKALPGAEPIPGSHGLAIGFTDGPPPGDENFVPLMKAQLAAYRRAYPNVEKIEAPLGNAPSTSVLPQTNESSIEAVGLLVSTAHPGDLDLAAYGLSRRGFDADVSPSDACESLVAPICGDDVSGRVLKAVELVEQATRLVMQHDDALATPAPDMILKHYTLDEPLPEWWGQARDNYLNAMNEMYRANTRAREGGRSYTLYLARRYEFGFEYMNCLQAVRKAGIAKRQGDSAAQIAELEKAIESMYGGLNALAAVSRSQSDRGTIALLNEFGYRALQKELAAADAAAAK